MTQPPDDIDKQAREVREAVDACWRLLVDLTCEQKAVALNELGKWLAEEATYDPASAPERRH